MASHYMVCEVAGMKLTQRHKMAIKRWLEHDPDDPTCPLDLLPPSKRGKNEDCEDLTFCQKLFPNLRLSECPCSQYSQKYVRNRARKILDES